VRLKALTVENFRGYLEPTTIRIDDFTSVIGRNDVGKSTLLEALDIFFNGGKPEPDDANIDGRGKPTRLSCEFDQLPAEVIIDAQAPTTLKGEHLLNTQGVLEIVKELDLGAKRITPRIYARALHPAVEGGHDLLQLNNTKLKERAKQLGVDLDGVNKSVNTSLRCAIWRSFGGLSHEERLIPLNDQDAKKVWDLLQQHMPTYALFQADRQSRDDDAEVTNPFDVAIKDAVKELETDLDKIRQRVQEQVEEVAQRTLTKLREMDPTLADELRTVFKAEPKWASFKLSLADHRDVPINKRGSGVRRLILLNFFRAEAERRQRTSSTPGIVYAIEEPESSQHPANQRLLIESLKELSTTEHTQVLITTHVPGVASLVDPNTIRYVRRDETGHPRVIADDDDILRLVADQLGVLPDKRVKLLLYVEGPNDVAFLERVSRLYALVDLKDDPRVAFVLTGGGNLKHWVNEHYLRDLGLPEIHIYDRDNDHGYKGQVNKVNARGNGDWATLTTKREIENYLHPDVIRDQLGIEIELDDDKDVPELAAKALHEKSESSKPWSEVDADKQRQKISNVKRRLCREVIERMTVDQLRDRDPDGEIEGWLTRISDKIA